MLEACAKVMAGICWTAWDQALWEAGCKCHRARYRRDAACVIPSEGYQYRYFFFIASSSLDQRPWVPVCPSLSLGVPPLSWMAWSPFIHNTVGKRRVGELTLLSTDSRALHFDTTSPKFQDQMTRAWIAVTRPDNLPPGIVSRVALKHCAILICL